MLRSELHAQARKQRTAIILLSLVALIFEVLAGTGWVCAWHWKQQADKYAYALSD